MKIKALEAKTDMRFTLPEEELKDAERRLRAWQRNEKKHGYDRTNSRRRFSVFQDGQVSHSRNSGGGTGHYYHVRVEFVPTTELTWRLIQPDMLHIGSYTDLPFEREHDVSVTPSGLRYFTKPWSYTEGSRTVRKGDTPENDYRVGIQIMGFLDDKKQIRELRDIVDALYLPVKKGEGNWWTETGGGGQGGSHPTIVLARKYVGDIKPEAERQIVEFYKSVLEFVLKYEVTEGFRFEDGGKTWAELEKEHSGLNMHEHIASSSAGRNGFYAPHLRIDAGQPIGNVHPEFRYNNGIYRRQDTVDLMCLTTFAETIFPPEGRRSK